MKKLFKLVSLLTLGLFFVACDDSASEGFTKSGKAGSLAVTYSSAKPLVVGDNTVEEQKSIEGLWDDPTKYKDDKKKKQSF